MDAPGTYNFNLQFVARGTGAVPLAIRVGAFNDFNPANDEQRSRDDPRTATATATAASTTSAACNVEWRSGGGGSMSWLFAALLLADVAPSRAQRRVQY